ncbi:peptidase S45 penicillin amidase (macronuclear) [Tetrahymena thermophila SB210]|uniref:Peptidase S45 penicillin amidase n=1 Tax=Tetrahymena thermophila (strain SB210) TaxID=312017 RepID=I7MJ44_TETTS|nr:peptidase S45 penicillin amidase [Tetrahymena thermophila SB210]EAR95945.2 peptidase S45 penicillin amidase [Tetrahymena thermophila SB210]|eukprot:XP_001016190.2 peptidase S45 penicillin amidase [Tetrahymena thermophila SB210]
MSFIKKASLTILVLLSVLAISIFVLEYRDYNGTVYHNFEKYGKVEISRDNQGIPHIKAKTFLGAVFGQGYAHAQDRLFQVFIKTKLARGEMSQLKGEAGLPYDIFFKTLGLKRIAEEIIEKLPKEELEIVQAYCDGFNLYQKELHVRPIEFIITGASLQEYTPVDIMINDRMIFLLLGYEYVFEPIRTSLANQFNEEIAIKMFAGNTDSQFVDVTITNDEDLKRQNLYEKFVKGKSFSHRAEFTEEQKQAFITSSLQEVLLELQSVLLLFTINNSFNNTSTTNYVPNGSNAWVVHGNHTKSGKPILASDPHLTNNIPSAQYQNEIIIEDEGVNAIGATLAGSPLILNGRTDYLAWGNTVLFADTSDLYKEEIKDDKYLVDGEWRQIKTVQEKIYIKGKEEPYILDVNYTHRGPIISYKFDKFAPNPLIQLGFSASICWNGEIKQATQIRATQKILRAKTHQQVLEGFGDIVGPVLAVSYATADGDIGFYGYGKIPIHKNTIQSQFIKDGTTTEQDWVRFTTPSEQPQSHNPTKGYIVTANNKFATDNMKGFLSVNLNSTPRAYRISQMIEEYIKNGKKIDVEDMKKMQADTVDSYGCDILPHLFKLFKERASNILKPEQYEQGLRMISHLEGWDCRIDANSYQATIFMGWEYFFAKSLLHQFQSTEYDRQFLTMGHLFEHFYLKEIQKWSLEGNEKDFDQFWCKTEENKGQQFSCLYNLFIAFSKVESYMEKEFGTPEVKKWEWGIIHTNNYPHTAFANIPILNKIYNRSVQSFGNRRTVAVAIQNWRFGSFSSAYGANYRMVADMDENGKDFWITDTGVSESVLSPHYDDQFKIHKNFGYLRMERGLESFKKNQKYLKVLEYYKDSKKLNKQNNTDI